MKPERNEEVADRIAEERSEDEGMPEHPAKARDPARWAADRRERVSGRRSARSPDHTGMFGLALVSCAALAAFASARGAFRWMRHKGGAARLPR
ncbi:MAG: hypothetical protein IRY87_04785 [Acetobacteraceae bacterium]|nr:hypothetical protein [Acetobacteraceae bacterium]